MKQTLILFGMSPPLPPVSIQMVSTSNASQTVTLVVWWPNQAFLNGTVPVPLRQLSAELVGLYLTYPPPPLLNVSMFGVMFESL